MTVKEMRELPVVELETEMRKAREKLWKKRFQARGEPIENPGEIRVLKRRIARMLTVLGEKSRAYEAARAATGGGST